MQLDKILGEIISLTKEIHLKQPSSKESFFRRFLYQENNLRLFGGAVGLEWWVTKKGLDALEDLWRLVTCLEPSFRTIDNKVFCEAVEDVLQKNALNEDLFHKDAIFFRQTNTLFEARTVNSPQQFALGVWNKISKSLIDSMLSWLVIYPLHRIKAKSFNLGFDGLSLLEFNDLDKWRNFIQRYPDAYYWSPETGKRIDRKDDSCYCGHPPSTWLICEIFGSDAEARTSAGRHMRIFLSILFTCLQRFNANLLTKSMAQEVNYSMQFPSDGQKAGCCQKCAFIGNLLPPLITDLEVTDGIMKEIQEWYRKYTSAPEQKKHRCTSASIFLNYGMVSDEVEGFIHFFIALDALFGEKDKVGQSICRGLKQLFVDEPAWVERGKKLYKLRCDLVHGETFSIKDWNGYSDYTRIFRSEPLKDVSEIAMKALRLYFDVAFP